MERAILKGSLATNDCDNGDGDDDGAEKSAANNKAVVDTTNIIIYATKYLIHVGMDAGYELVNLTDGDSSVSAARSYW
jgi:hypothetical protein